MSENPTYVNLGCGTRYHPRWINIDLEPQGEGVLRADLSRGVPLADNSCDVVYHAAVLEHVRRPDATRFMRECHRILKPGGTIRVGVPDLEVIAKVYLSKLESALAGDEAAVADYDWMMLELLDQTVRENGGGEMASYLRQRTIPNEDFVFDRIGDEGRNLVREMRREALPQRLELLPLHRRLRKWLALLPTSARRFMAPAITRNSEQKALAIGRFRLGGEVHQWMYDRFSLGRLIQSVGFDEITVQSAEKSGIPGWSEFYLDVLADGQVAKPDLFFMEARKPVELLSV